MIGTTTSVCSPICSSRRGLPAQPVEGFGGTETAACERLVHHVSKCVNVAPNRRLSRTEQLRGHVRERALHRSVGVPEVNRCAGDAEVRQQWPSRAVHHDIRGFQIAMEHTLCMDGG